MDLLTEPLLLAVPPGHRLAARGRVRLKEMADEPFITVSRETGLRTIVDQPCERAGFLPHVAFEGNDVETLKAWSQPASGSRSSQAAPAPPHHHRCWRWPTPELSARSGSRGTATATALRRSWPLQTSSPQHATNDTAGLGAPLRTIRSEGGRHGVSTPAGCCALTEHGFVRLCFGSRPKICVWGTGRGRARDRGRSLRNRRAQPDSTITARDQHSSTAAL